LKYAVSNCCVRYFASIMSFGAHLLLTKLIEYTFSIMLSNSLVVEPKGSAPLMPKTVLSQFYPTQTNITDLPEAILRLPHSSFVVFQLVSTQKFCNHFCLVLLSHMFSPLQPLGMTTSTILGKLYKLNVLNHDLESNHSDRQTTAILLISARPVLRSEVPSSL